MKNCAKTYINGLKLDKKSENYQQNRQLKLPLSPENAAEHVLLLVANTLHNPPPAE
jgi:hypothetical protein